MEAAVAMARDGHVRAPRRVLMAMVAATALGAAAAATTIRGEADVIVGAAPITGGVTFQTPYPVCPGIGPDRFTFQGLATGVVLDADVITGYRGDISVNATGSSSGAFCDVAETGAITVNAAGTNASGGSINCVQHDGQNNPIPLSGGYARVGTHVHVTVSGVCTINGFVNKAITFIADGEFYPDANGGNGITQPVTNAHFAGLVTVEPDLSQPLALPAVPGCAGGGPGGVAPQSALGVPLCHPVS
jgi:hypothetical protein